MFSVVLFAVVPSLTCLVALICCICHKGNGIKGEKELCNDADFQKPRRKLYRERGQKTYVKRLGSKHYKREYDTAKKNLEMEAIKSMQEGEDLKLSTMQTPTPYPFGGAETDGN